MLVFGGMMLFSVHQLHDQLIEKHLQASIANLSATLIDSILLKEYGRIERHLASIIEEQPLTFVSLSIIDDKTPITAGNEGKTPYRISHLIVLDDEPLATLTLESLDPVSNPYLLLFMLFVSLVVFAWLSFWGIQRKLLKHFVTPIYNITEQARNNIHPTPNPTSTTEVKQLAAQLTQLLIEREQAIDNIQQLAEAQSESFGKLCTNNRLSTVGQLTAEVAHELNTPLSNILVYSQWLQDNPHDAPDALRAIEDQARKAGKIVQRILSQTRMPIAQAESTDLAQLCRCFIDLMRPIALRKQCTITLHILSEATQVLAIAQSIEQILLNLTSNSLYAGATRIDISITQDEQGISLQHCDNGKGINETLKSKLFQAFATNKPVGEGNGLGLFICKRLASEMRAELSLIATQNNSTCFQLTFKQTTP
jgi:signal transduction histidine kinase